MVMALKSVGLVIPVDTVINLMITLVRFTSTHPSKNIQVFNCTSGSSNCLKIAQKLKTPCSAKYPSKQLYRYPSFQSTESKLFFELCKIFNHLMPAYLFDALMYLKAVKPSMVKTRDGQTGF